LKKCALELTDMTKNFSKIISNHVKEVSRIWKIITYFYLLKLCIGYKLLMCWTFFLFIKIYLFHTTIFNYTTENVWDFISTLIVDV
jgi:hypothetical protein